MENGQNEVPRRPVRRRRKNPVYVFIHSYLPILVAVALVVLFIIFASNSLRRSRERKELERQESIAALESQQAHQEELDVLAAQVIADARVLMNSYDFEGAVALIEEYEGNLFDYAEMVKIRETCLETLDSMVTWSSPSLVPNLSFQLLVADPERAFAHEGYGTSFRNNFVTVDEFSAILEQLYYNGYVLVDQDDLIAYSESTGFSAKALQLPSNKKPIMLTQTQVYDYAYMTDGRNANTDNSAGFATRLVVEGGQLKSEYIDANGQTVTGAYDLIPILEDFIAAHPDFSYQGARATIAVSGYDGIFGYRTDPETIRSLGQDHYDDQLRQVRSVISALQERGYQFACYTYGNVRYGQLSATQIKADLDKWTAEVAPLLGNVNTLVLAKQSDFSDTQEPYNGDKFQLLYGMGFRYFYGFCDSAETWACVAADHMRQGRLLVTGSALTNDAELFNNLFDPATVLDPLR